jgi:hypothetical protein
MREMEHYVRSVKGAPFLYADTFLTPDEFNDMFNLELYNKVPSRPSCPQIAMLDGSASVAETC